MGWVRARVSIPMLEQGFAWFETTIITHGRCTQVSYQPAQCGQMKKREGQVLKAFSSQQ